MVFHGRIQRGGGGAWVPENHKNIGFLCNTDPDPLKSQSFQASIQCLATIGPPAKRYFTGGSMMAHLHRYLYPLSTHQLKNVIKFGPPLKKLYGSTHGSLFSRFLIWQSCFWQSFCFGIEGWLPCLPNCI